MTSQKDIFLASEGDAYFRRNQAALESRDYSADWICKRIAAFGNERLRILEIGCSDGSRLRYLSSKAGHDVTGIDPSEAAIEQATRQGVKAFTGTADALPFAAGSFDVLIFGFCLYLCDDSDLFRIAAEADRVLADPGWLLIFDFAARAPVYKPYHHRPGVWSRKMDYSSLFSWHPGYALASYEKCHHSTLQWSDDVDEWVSLACLRKHGRSSS
jgi:SAM-dependent methyltransferase